MIDASYFLTAGDPVAVVVERDGKPISISVKSVTHPVMEPREVSTDALVESLTDRFNLGNERK